MASPSQLRRETIHLTLYYLINNRCNVSLVELVNVDGRGVTIRNRTYSKLVFSF